MVILSRVFINKRSKLSKNIFIVNALFTLCYLNVQVGGDSWVTKCPESKLPPRLRVSNGQLVKLDGAPYNIYEGTTGANAITAIRGGNYGNQYLWSEAPDFNRTGYFSSLKFLGHKFLRLLFNPDKYIADKIYRNRIEFTY